VKYSIEHLSGPFFETCSPWGHSLPSMNRHKWYAERSDGTVVQFSQFLDQPNKYFVNRVYPDISLPSIFAMLDYICENEFQFLS
jgi:hypothetical protein